MAFQLVSGQLSVIFDRIKSEKRSNNLKNCISKKRELKDLKELKKLVKFFIDYKNCKVFIT